MQKQGVVLLHDKDWESNEEAVTISGTPNLRESIEQRENKMGPTVL